MTAQPIDSAHQDGALDIKALRADFPILARHVYEKPLTYLDNAASAQKPRVVIEAMRRAYEHEYANVHRGLHYLSNTATEAFEAARESARAFLNAASTDEIIFTQNGTDAMNLVAQSFGGSRIGAGDEIVLTIMEHHSNIVPWHFHRERCGATLQYVGIDDAGNFSLDAFAAALTPRTKMVAITHMSNMLGTIVPIKQVVEIAHARGIPVMVDGCQGAVHLPVDVQDLDCDFYVFTGHKTYGPSGIGVLYGKREHLDAMPPFRGGGEMVRDVFEDHITYAEPPHKFEAGTPAIVQAIGLGVALDYMQSIGRDRIAAYEAQLKDYAHERLGAMNSLRIFGNADEKGAILSFELIGAHAHDVSTIIDRDGVAVRAGTHCVQPLLTRFGVTSTCRASMAFYNTREDIDRLATALEKARSLLLGA